MKEHVFYVCLSLAVVAVFGYLVAGFFGAAVALSLLALLLLSGHLYALYRLADWLSGEVKITPRFASGSIWQMIMDTHVKNSERHQKNKAQLQMSLRRFDHLVAVMPTGVLMVREGGLVEWASELGKNHFGLTGQVSHNPLVFGNQKAGLPLAEHINSGELQQFLTQVPVSHPQHLTLPINHKHKKTWLELSLVPFEANTSLLISADISAKEQLNATRTDFVANVSHELRTPLTVIQGFLETLKDYPDLDDATRGEFVGLMKDESDKMLWIINDLLMLSQIESSDNSLITDMVNLSDICKSIVADTKALSERHHTDHRIMTDIDDDVWVMGRAKELYSALSNLAFNAVLHTSDADIEIKLVRQDNQATFWVRDTGEGIDEIHLPRLTERFYRASPGRERSHKAHGSGLGLAITKHALALHGSELNVQSTLGVGTTFSAAFSCVDA